MTLSPKTHECTFGDKGEKHSTVLLQKETTVKELGIVFYCGEWFYAWSVMHKSWSFQLQNFLSPVL